MQLYIPREPVPTSFETGRTRGIQSPFGKLAPDVLSEKKNFWNFFLVTEIK